jgi:hypothetical protein
VAPTRSTPTELNAGKTPDALVLVALIPAAYNQDDAIVVNMAAVEQRAGWRKSGAVIGSSSVECHIRK